MTVQGRRCTVEEYEHIAMQPESADLLIEYIAGEIVETEPNFYIAVLGANITGELGRFVYDRKLGYLTGAAAVYVVLDERYMPNVAYVSKARQPTISPDDFLGPVPPDLAVEIISPSDRPRHLLWKLINYLRAGTTVWVVDPEEKLVEVYQPGPRVKTYNLNDTLDGGDVLPGFTLAVKDIFPE
jgi:Uma2 family endonuclease